MVLEILVDFECLQNFPRIYFFSQHGPNMDPTFPQDGPKLEPKLNHNLSENGLGSEVGARADSGSMFFINLGKMFNSFLNDSGMMFG